MTKSVLAGLPVYPARFLAARLPIGQFRRGRTQVLLERDQPRLVDIRASEVKPLKAALLRSTDRAPEQERHAT